MNEDDDEQIAERNRKTAILCMFLAQIYSDPVDLLSSLQPTDPRETQMNHKGGQQKKLKHIDGTAFMGRRLTGVVVVVAVAESNRPPTKRATGQDRGEF